MIVDLGIVDVVDFVKDEGSGDERADASKRSTYCSHLERSPSALESRFGAALSPLSNVDSMIP